MPAGSLRGLRDLPVLVAPLGYLLAALLGVSALLLSLLTEGRWRRRRLVCSCCAVALHHDAVLRDVRALDDAGPR